MTNDDIKRLRALAEGPGICDPTTVLGLLDEIERLRNDNARLLVAKLPTADDYDALVKQLAAMTAARDEACDIADASLSCPFQCGCVSHSNWQRIAQLRAVGGAK
jgi:hypothetical protein